MKIVTFGFLSCLIVLNFSCVALSNFQNPKTIAPKKIELGVGSTFSHEDGDEPIITAELFGRYGIAKNLDVGIKFPAGLPLFIYVADIKYQIISSETFNVSIDFGVSYFNFKSTKDSSIQIDNSGYGFYPTLIMGYKRLIFGGKIMYLFGDYEYERFAVKKPIPGVFIGYEIKFFDTIIHPEIHVYHTPDYGTWFSGGIALRYDI